MPFWAVAQTVANREAFVADRIADSGFEVFSPKTRINAVWPKGPGQYRVVALFPGYLFARIIDRWRAVSKTVGVLGLIMSGEQPAHCPDLEIDKIKALTMRNGLVRLPDPPKTKPRLLGGLVPGQCVRIVSGPFCGFEAIYDGMSARERECVLLDILGRQTRVELAPNDTLASMGLCG